MGIFSRRGCDARVPIDMTPMIDVVFQLLAFFMMTLHVVDTEGDFQIRMPREANGAQPAEPLLPLRLRLTADAEGELAGIQLNDRSFGSLPALRGHLAEILTAVGPGSGPMPEVEIECDYQLKYQHTMAAVTAISGERLRDGTVVKLIERIRFSPPVQPPR